MGIKAIVLIALLAIVLGSVTGFTLTKVLATTQTPSNSQDSNLSANNQSAQIIGSPNEQAFPDTATGTLQSGGLGNEGTHQLIRDGGPSQTVYVVSSLVDLDQFVGKKVTVWGQTLKASKAPWLMDVGRIKLN